MITFLVVSLIGALICWIVLTSGPTVVRISTRPISGASSQDFDYAAMPYFEPTHRRAQ